METDAASPSNGISVNDHGANPPTKTCELRNSVMDSRIWNKFNFRPDDIVIATWGKTGTTWMQQIMAQLIFKGAPDADPQGISPWLDFVLMPEDEILTMMDALPHRRYVKTHLPLDAMVYNPQAKYIYVARDARDVLWSLHNHLFYATDAFYDLLRKCPKSVGPVLGRPPPDPRQYFLDWLEDDTDPSKSISPFWHHIRSWWQARHNPNILLVNFCDLKKDMGGEIRRIAEFLDMDVPAESWPLILEHCSFGWMKSHANLVSPLAAENFWEGGGDTFIHKGENGRWRDSLSQEDVERYLQKAKVELGDECANWLANGRM